MTSIHVDLDSVEWWAGSRTALPALGSDAAMGGHRPQPRRPPDGQSARRRRETIPPKFLHLRTYLMLGMSIIEAQLGFTLGG